MFGGIDIFVNNVSVIWLCGMLEILMKWFDLMQQVNLCGSFLCVQVCLLYLLQVFNLYILILVLLFSFDLKWWGLYIGYMLVKMGMSFVMLGLVVEFGLQGVVVNVLWLCMIIVIDVINMIFGVDSVGCCMLEILVDVVYVVLICQVVGFSGQFLFDDEVLVQVGIIDLGCYVVDFLWLLLLDLFLD